MEKRMRSLIFTICMAAVAAAAQPRPNVIFILTDDMGYGDMGCAGHPYVQTPNIDRLADEGTMFTDFYVNSGVCAPSRTAFMTGLFPARNNVHHIYSNRDFNQEHGIPDYLDPEQLTLADVMKQAGYLTAHIGKWHLCGTVGGSPAPEEYGFDFHMVSHSQHASPIYKTRWASTDHQVTESSHWIMEDAIEFIKQYKDTGKPFFLNLWTLVPHALLQPTPEELAVYDGLTVDPDDFPSWMKDYVATANNPDSQMKVYCASMTSLDTAIGKLLDYLDAAGLADDTLILFSSDNGPEDYHVGNAANAGLGSPGEYRGRKRSPYLGGMRVPMIVRWPGNTPAGVQNSAVWSGVEFLPTFASLLGVELPPELDIDGENVAPLLTGGTSGRQEPLFWEWKYETTGIPDYIAPQVCMLDGTWWAGWDPDGSRVELYDVTVDPAQLSNLKDAHPGTAAGYVDELSAWKASIPESAFETSTISSANHGDWEDAGTWNTGIPTPGDVVYIQSHSVTSGASVGILNALATLQDSGHMVMQDGSDIEVIKDVTVNKGVLTLEAGSLLTHTGTGYLKVGRDAGKHGTVIIDGGTYDCNRAIFMNLATSGDARATMEIRDGFMDCSWQIIFGGSPDSEARLLVTGGTAQFSYIDFDQHALGDQGQVGEVTVDGGDLILTTGNEAGSIAFAGTYNKVFYECGSITFKGVDNEEGFNAFATNQWKVWVDAGNVTSAVHSASELKSMIRFIGGDAVVAASEAELPSIRLTSVASGAWTNGAVWDKDLVPRDGDNVWIADDAVTVTGADVGLNSLALLKDQSGSLALGSGTHLHVGGEVAVMEGELTVGTGARLSHTNGNSKVFMKIARDAGTAGTVTIDGGTYASDRDIYLTQHNSTGATGTLHVAGGTVNGARSLIFGGASNSVSTLLVSGGTATFQCIDFDQSFANPGGGTQTEEVTVDGGNLVLTHACAALSLQFAGPHSKVFFEDGSITIAGVDTPDDFSTFTNVFNVWVDDGRLESTTYTSGQLKSMLQYSYLGDAVLTDEVLQGYGTMTIAAGSDALDITSAWLYPTATNTLQVRTDLAAGTWSNLTSSVGTTSNTWTIAPLTDAQRFFRIIAE
jgi:N-acetylgalactosamine-6-sulfatase